MNLNSHLISYKKLKIEPIKLSRKKKKEYPYTFQVGKNFLYTQKMVAQKIITAKRK